MKISGFTISKKGPAIAKAILIVGVVAICGILFSRISSIFATDSLISSSYSEKVKVLQATVKKFASDEAHNDGDGFFTKTAAYEEAVSRSSYVGGCGGIDCGGFVTILMRESGWDPNYNSSNGNTAAQYEYLLNSKEWDLLNPNGEDISESNLRAGDVAVTRGKGHTFAYVGAIEGRANNIASSSLCARAPSAGASYETPGAGRYAWFRKKFNPENQKVTFAQGSVTKTYGDAAFTNKATTTGDGAISYSSSKTDVATVDGNGKVTIKSVGTTTITATAAATASYNKGTATYTLTVKAAEQKVTFAQGSVTKTYGDAAFTNKATTTGDGAISYSSSKTSVAEVDKNGKVTIKAAGTATITATAAATTNYNKGTATYTLTVKAAEQKVTFAQGSVTKTYGDAAFTNKATTTGDGAISYSSSKTDVATVDGNGKVTIKAAGTATITATAAATASYNKGTATYTLTVKDYVPIEYEVLSVEGGDYVLNSGGSVTFRINASYEKFGDEGKVLVDESVVPKSAYTISSGSTLVTIGSSYLDKLSVGEHSLKAVFANGDTASANFTVSAPAPSPSDSGNPTPPGGSGTEPSGPGSNAGPGSDNGGNAGTGGNSGTGSNAGSSNAAGSDDNPKLPNTGVSTVILGGSGFVSETLFVVVLGVIFLVVKHLRARNRLRR